MDTTIKRIKIEDIYSQGDCCSYELFIVCTANKLTRMFGKPEVTSDFKTSKEWAVELESGTQFYIYDYKYAPKYNEQYEWHIGGLVKHLEKGYKNSPQRQEIANYFLENCCGVEYVAEANEAWRNKMLNK